MRTRKTHSKSRFGCLPCKQRRIKCGEESPTCRNCTRRGVQCIYALAAASNAGVASQNAASDICRAPKCVRSDHLQSTPFCHCGHDAKQGSKSMLRESRLMVQYMTSTCVTMSHGEEDIGIWQHLIPEEAAQHNFLMDALLSLTSLHLATQNSDSKWDYIAAAIQYQNSASKDYRIALEAITDDNKHALFASSIIMTILALALSTTCPDPQSASPYAFIMSTVELIQGIGLIHAAVGYSISEGKYKGLFRPDPGYTQTILSEDIALSFSELRDLARGADVSTGLERYRSYISGIDRLQEAFAAMEASSYLAPVLIWPSSVGKELLSLFREDDPMADAIFMYYGVLLLHARDRWWANDVGKHLIDDLASSVCAKGPQWAALARRAQEIAVSYKQQ